MMSRDRETTSRPSYDRGVHRARQAPRTVAGLVLIALAAISWGTSGSVLTRLPRRAAASPLLVGVARAWLARRPRWAGQKGEGGSLASAEWGGVGARTV